MAAGIPETRSVQINEQTCWLLTANFLAWYELEKRTGRSALELAREVLDNRLSRMLEFLWALLASQRKATNSDMTFEDMLEAMPAMGSDLYGQIEKHVADLVYGSFFGKSGEEMLATIQAEIQKITNGASPESTSPAGNTSPVESSDSPSGTSGI